LKKNWYEPTRSAGIPTTVVVDAQSKIAWIGHPGRLDSVLDELLASKFDYSKAATDHSDASGNSDAMLKVFAEYAEAMKAKDYTKALAVVDDNSQFAKTMWLMRFAALINVDAAEAFAQAKLAVEKNEREAGAFLQTITGTDGLPREMYEFAAEKLKQAHKPSDFMHLARAAYQLGDYAAAVEYQLKMREFALGLPRRPPPEAMDKLDDDLKLYQSKLK
jgi:hypothetical protein